MDQSKVHEIVHGKVHRTTSTDAIARSIVTLASAGQNVPLELARMLADTILTDAPVRLAQKIRGGGTHVLTYALELANLLLEQPHSLKGGDHVAKIAS